jgi:rhodanese-related sulfurtransferase
MLFVGGGLLGVFAFAEGFPLYERFYESTALGPVKVFGSLGLGAGTFTFLLILAAVAAFAVTTRIERRVDPVHAPSLAFPSRRHALAAAGLIAVGALGLVFPDYRTRLLARATDPRALASHAAASMSADELAFRIVDREPRLRVVDIRPAAAIAAHPIPGALAIPMRDLFGKEWRAPLARRHLKKVIVAGSESEERSAYLLLQELGYDNLACLEGGFPAFASTILEPGAPAAAGERWASDVLHFRENARTELAKMVAAAKSAGTKQPKKEKKIQGGC